MTIWKTISNMAFARRGLGSALQTVRGWHTAGTAQQTRIALRAALPARAFASAGAESKTHFGFQTVEAKDKAKLVAEVFSAVASKYDLMNDFMSAGLHRVWKDELVQSLGPQRGMTIVDLAGGTGDVTFRIVDALRTQRGAAASRIMVCDINAAMLQEGRRRAQERGYAPGDTWLAASGGVQGTFSDGEIGVEFVQGDAESLPFEDGSVDALTIAFGLRNVTRTLPALKEIHRVLKRGGRFMCMEFSKVSSDSALLLDVCWHLSLHALIAYAFTLLCACSIRNMWT